MGKEKQLMSRDEVIGKIEGEIMRPGLSRLAAIYNFVFSDEPPIEPVLTSKRGIMFLTKAESEV